MTVRSLVTFRSDLADKGIEADDGNSFLEWPGQVHARVMAEILRTLGWRISQMADDHEHGWTLEANLGRNGIWMQVTPLDEVIVMIEGAHSLLSRLFRPRAVAEFTAMLTSLDAAIQADDRFRDIRWFTSKEHNSGAPGAPTPISDGRRTG
jgi:hypothetical protein